MENKELIINAYADIITDVAALAWLLVFGLIANYIWKTPKLKKSVERIYKIMGFIITTVISSFKSLPPHFLCLKNNMQKLLISF